MKAFLMHRDRNFDAKADLPWNADALMQDLELNTLFNAMSLDDEFVFDIARRAVLTGLANDVATVRHRQDVLRDCLGNPLIVREIYEIATSAVEAKRKTYYWFGFGKHPSSILYSSIGLLNEYVTALEKLRKIADEHGTKFTSDGFSAFFALLKADLSDEYLARIRDHLRDLKFPNGVLISAGLGKGNKGTGYVLHRLKGEKRGLMKRIFGPKPPGYTFRIAPQDESGARALGDLRDIGINSVANALGQSAEHVLAFFNMLRVELAFYIGCLNLHQKLEAKGERTSFPVPLSADCRRLSFTGLYDVSLTLTMEPRVVGNDVDADGKTLVIITGANKGGKSVFLRSVGLAQLMMQCGMFVPAESFSSSICDGLFTHYKREEDPTMKGGKLDEELNRMGEIIDHLTPNPMLLFNESFAATNEREGSQIAEQIVRALLEKGVRMFFVTHLYEFARVIHDTCPSGVLFLRAGRQADGSRTLKLVQGEPLPTSYGQDLYDMIFGVRRLATNATVENDLADDAP
jgi:hypothetical protein